MQQQYQISSFNYLNCVYNHVLKTSWLYQICRLMPKHGCHFEDLFQACAPSLPFTLLTGNHMFASLVKEVMLPFSKLKSWLKTQKITNNL